jgi:hypothetical protein
MPLKTALERDVNPPSEQLRLSHDEGLRSLNTLPGAVRMGDTRNARGILIGNRF